MEWETGRPSFHAKVSYFNDFLTSTIRNATSLRDTWGNVARFDAPLSQCFPFQLRQKASQFTALEREMEEKRTENSAQLARLRELQQQLQSKASELGDMQGSLEAKDNTVKEANTLVDKVKALHVEHCSELEQQIDAVRGSEHSTPNFSRVFLRTYTVTFVVLVRGCGRFMKYLLHPLI